MTLRARVRNNHKKLAAEQMTTPTHATGTAHIIVTVRKSHEFFGIGYRDWQ